MLLAAQLFAGGEAVSSAVAAGAGANKSVRACARNWSLAARALPELPALRRQLSAEGYALLPPTAAGVDLAAAVRRAARSPAAAAEAFELSSDGARLQGRARLWEAALRGVPRAFEEVVASLLASDDSGAEPLRASLVQPFLALPGAPGQSWHRDYRGAAADWSVFLYLSDAPSACATMLVPRSHGAEADFPCAPVPGAALPQVAAAACVGAALIFTHALVHRGQAVPAAADDGPGGGGVCRLFGYVLGGHAGGTGMPADAFARLGYEETRVGAFEEEEVEWPTAEEDGGAGEGEGDGAALSAT